MPGEWVCPECVGVFWIADGDVAAHSFCVAFAGEYSEGAGLDTWEKLLGLWWMDLSRPRSDFECDFYGGWDLPCVLESSDDEVRNL